MRQRMLERGISMRDIKYIFREPHVVERAYLGRQKWSALVRGRRLVIIFKIVKVGARMLITAYWKDEL